MLTFAGMIDVILKKGKEKAITQRHPWVFSGAVERVKGKPANGEIVRLMDFTGKFMAYGFYNDQSRVALRLLEWDENVNVDENWFRAAVKASVNSRQTLLANGKTNTCRLVFSESDYLPGLIVDKYAGHLAVQVLTSGMEKMLPVIIDELQTLLSPESIFDKSDASSRSHEGMETSNISLTLNPPPEFVEVLENGIRYHINIAEGQKSGFYCDQRDNRNILAAMPKEKKCWTVLAIPAALRLIACKMAPHPSLRLTAHNWQSIP